MGNRPRTGERCVSIEVERDLTEIDTAPVRQMAAVKAQVDDRTPVRVSRQASVFQRQRLESYLFSCGVPTARTLFTNRPRVNLETFDNTHLLFHFSPVRGELHHRHRRYGAQVMRPQKADQPFGQFWKVIIKLLSKPPHQKGKAFEQALYVRVARAGFHHQRLARDGFYGARRKYIYGGGMF